MMSRGVGSVWKLDFYSRNAPPNVEGREAGVPVLAEQPTRVRESQAVTSLLTLADGVSCGFPALGTTQEAHIHQLGAPSPQETPEQLK